jgi:protein-S-isoprenylcysteine O-methyltransferase Ste14
MAAMKPAKILYGGTFVVALPVLLIFWARAAAPNVSLPAFGNATTGAAFLLVGVVLMAAAMIDLWRRGGGLPMNAFPPPRFVKQGAFRWVPHPIYTGFVLASFGVSMAASSAAGLWLVTPAAALGCAALVLGYERIDLMKRFGKIVRILPADDETSPPLAIDRVRYFVCVVIPWIALYELTIRIGVAGTSFGMPFEDRLPILLWTTPAYQSIYVVVALAPWIARTRRDLRKLMISAWVATAIVFPFYWVLPSSAPRRPMGDLGVLSGLLRLEREADAPVAAFPSFHVLWSIFVARLFRRRWLGVAYVAAVSASCVTTGMHYVADIGAAVLIAPAFLYPERGWGLLRSLAERLANSWREWRIGPVRVINHGIYGALGSFAQAAIVMAAVGRAAEVLATCVAGLIGAALWAQWVEGSSRLRRPFGFYGGLIGVILCCLVFDDRWTLLAAHCLAAPFLQALGRLRCLVNGCCHGSPAPDQVGIRVIEPHSRVTRLAGFSGVPVHPTQLYSILSNAVVSAFLWRLWMSGCPLSLICGVYLMGNGLARFVEEAYRGEPQTHIVLGLRFYQWIAAVSVLGGMVCTSLISAAADGLTFSASGWILAAVFGLVAGAALGVDFPETDRPFARLT